MTAETARTNPFTENVLDTFDPVVAHIRYPVTLGLYEEGDNLGLFIAPVDLPLIQRLTAIDPTDRALVLSGAAILGDAFMAANDLPRLVPWSEIHTLDGELDLIHVPRSTPIDLTTIDIPTPILAAPAHAVPAELGSKLAVSFNDGCHAAVISPDRKLIEHCLTGFIEAYAATAANSTSAPPIDSDLVAPLLRPMAPGEWRELRFQARQRYWMIEVAEQGDPRRSTRWVSEGAHGRWRNGWSW